MLTTKRFAFIKTYFLIILISYLSACGFHLRGNNELAGSLEAFYLTGEKNYGDTAAEIIRAAEQNNIKYDSQAEWTVDILNEDLEQRRMTSTQSVSNDEFLISLTINFNLIHRNTNNDMTYGPINVRRETIFQGNEDQAASKDNERNLLISELRQQVALQVLRQTQIISSNPPECGDCSDEAESTTISE